MEQPKDKMFLIAEIGINHNGDLNIAKLLIDKASEAGFDAVKFQKRDIDQVYTQEFLDTPERKSMGQNSKRSKIRFRIFTKRLQRN